MLIFEESDAIITDVRRHTYFITPLIRPLTYKVRVFFPNESFGKNLGRNGFIQAMLYLSNQKTKNVRHMK